MIKSKLACGQRNYFDGFTKIRKWLNMPIVIAKSSKMTLTLFDKGGGGHYGPPTMNQSAAVGRSGLCKPNFLP